MGRRPKTRNIEKEADTSKLERTNQSTERVILQPVEANPSLGRVESQPESLNPSVGNVELHTENGSPSLVGAMTQPKQLANSAKPSNPNKRIKHHTGSVRRSERIQHAITPVLNPDVQPGIEEITLSETDEEDDPPPQREQDMPEPIEPSTLGEMNLEEKIDYIVQRLETQEKTIEDLKSEVTMKSVLSGSPSKGDVRYKSLYISSQKKIDFLTEENKQLSAKLETALSKLETYENGNHVFSNVMDKLKDVILVSNLSKTTETAINMSSQALHNAFSAGAGRGSRSPAAKRRNLATKRR
uniref:Uncharacterized protein n=1 Tax=Fagus sylvatica TaxID=28930 RepID=A0A2N9H0R9_FAGSY